MTESRNFSYLIFENKKLYLKLGLASERIGHLYCLCILNGPKYFSGSVNEIV